MNIQEITSLEQPELAPYCQLTEHQLRQASHFMDDTNASYANGIFIAESPKVIHVALNAGYRPLSLLCERRHITGDAASIIERCGDIPVYTGNRELLASLTGYTLTRGVLCAMSRPQLPSIADICSQAHRIVIIQGVSDTTNIGAIFRSAAALGIDAVLLTPDSCDPLNRRAVRVSMGSVFLVPWTWTEPSFHDLRAQGFKIAAMALSDDSIPLGDPMLNSIERLAILMGTEGDGLPHEAISAADYVVRIPMSHQVDSLNVAAAAAVAFWELRRR
ncbi:MAG: RNA methyltransferase [Prevotella sp.]|nr:RNA methyltransferase [Prevotella sp.]